MATPDQQSNFGGFGPSMTVDDEGNVYAAWPTTYTSGLAPKPAGALLISKSTDHGKTWTTSEITPYDFRIGSFVTIVWGPDGGPQGTLHVASDGNEDPSNTPLTNIYYYRSTDGGKRWTDGRNVTDDDPKQAFPQLYPKVAVAPNCRVDIAFFDTRDDPGIRSNDVYYTYSTDNGTTWSKNIRISDQSIDRRIGVFSNNADVNAPPGLAATSAFTVVGWDDTRNGDPVGQAQDIYTSSVQYKEVGGGTSKGARLALAGVVRLLVVGLAHLVVAMFTRSGGTRPPAGTTEPSTAAKSRVG